MAMLNKMKFWRKTAKKQADGSRTGRMLRNYMSSNNTQGTISPIHMWLFKAAGIPTPVYDAQQKAYKDAMEKYKANDITDSITDVEFTEGALNAI